MADRYDASLPVAERKRHGVFYTPAPVVRYLVRATAPRGPVADLSCGDGAFLLEAAQAGMAVMGIDRDPLALARAQEALEAQPAVARYLQCGDGLASALPWTPDVVLGNPPYLEAKKADPALKDFCRARFPGTARGSFDVFICFLKAGLEALPPDGRLGYIIPNKFFVAEYARPLREEVLATTTLEEIVDVSDIPTFRDAAVYPVMLVLRKAPPPPGHRVRIGQVSELAQLETGTFAKGEIVQEHWLRTQRRIIWLPPADPLAHGLVERLMADPRAGRLGELLDIRWAISFHRAGLREQFITPAPAGAFPRRLLGGRRFHGNGDVRRYRLAWSGWWIDYDEVRARALDNQFPAPGLFDAPKLLIAQNARRIIATLDRDGFICKDTFLVGRQRGAVSLVFLLGLLNSALLSYLYGIMFKATHIGGAYLHYLACYLDDLPVLVPEDGRPIEALVERLLDPALPEAERQAMDARLDTAVFDLYGLSAPERALVRAAVPYAWGEGGGRRGRWQA